MEMDKNLHITEELFTQLSEEYFGNNHHASCDIFFISTGLM
jgi:hypothetical protein